MARILVIDDDAALVETVSRQLRAEGHDVRTAADGVAGLRLLEQEPADVVLTDVYMPGMDGIEFTIRLGQLPRRPGVIAMSGGGWRDKEDLLAIATRLGAARSLAKPFSNAELLEAVNGVLGTGDRRSHPEPGA